jgi:hypothetical protein
VQLCLSLSSSIPPSKNLKSYKQNLNVIAVLEAAIAAQFPYVSIFNDFSSLLSFFQLI